MCRNTIRHRFSWCNISCGSVSYAVRQYKTSKSNIFVGFRLLLSQNIKKKNKNYPANVSVYSLTMSSKETFVPYEIDDFCSFCAATLSYKLLNTLGLWIFVISGHAVGLITHDFRFLSQ